MIGSFFFMNKSAKLTQNTPVLFVVHSMVINDKNCGCMIFDPES